MFKRVPVLKERRALRTVTGDEPDQRDQRIEANEDTIRTLYRAALATSTYRSSTLDTASVQKYIEDHVDQATSETYILMKMIYDIQPHRILAELLMMDCARKNRTFAENKTFGPTTMRGFLSLFEDSESMDSIPMTESHNPTIPTSSSGIEICQRPLSQRTTPELEMTEPRPILDIARVETPQSIVHFDHDPAQALLTPIIESSENSKLIPLEDEIVCDTLENLNQSNSTQQTSDGVIMEDVLPIRDESIKMIIEEEERAELSAIEDMQRNLHADNSSSERRTQYLHRNTRNTRRSAHVTI